MAITWQHREEHLPLGSSPDYAALGKQGWQLVAVYDAPFPQSANGNPETGRVFVFKREVVA